ncbi:acyl-CoA dehydrogenase [Streptomyces fuscichromogenes]|uniref:Acyl-CoA dehydrogenase n=2 Tax=Streptomyces fuscichromogenes TaxID=1324013 RepID=A0A918CNY3_9ACTN|nr:acyl-CoA dehydrogenase [Streptomyces fuscichromogenes]
MEGFELRRQDFSLNAEQLAVREAFGDFFRKECRPSVVREAEPLGFDTGLWRRLLDMGAAAMALPETVGGHGATLVDLALVAEEQGRTVAPVPLVAHTVATRLLARAGAPGDVLAAAASGERLVTLALQPAAVGRRQLLPEGAIARDVVAWTPKGLALYSAGRPGTHLRNQGSTALAWWDPGAADKRVELITGPEAFALFGTAVAEWKLLTAAALVGIADSALSLGVEFAKTRRTLGVPIGSLQGVSFPLADVATAVAGARNLVWKAAWFAEYEPASRPELPLAAFDCAARTATDATRVSVHVQGGLGFTVEADISLFFLRAKGWSALGGDPGEDRKRIASARLRVV